MSPGNRQVASAACLMVWLAHSHSQVMFANRHGKHQEWRCTGSAAVTELSSPSWGCQLAAAGVPRLRHRRWTNYLMSEARLLNMRVCRAGIMVEMPGGMRQLVRPACGNVTASVSYTLPDLCFAFTCAGITVEMHGSVRQLVCPACGTVVGLTPAAARTLKARKPLRCAACGHAPIRTKVMLYDDAEGGSCWMACFVLLDG